MDARTILAALVLIMAVAGLIYISIGVTLDIQCSKDCRPNHGVLMVGFSCKCLQVVPVTPPAQPPCYSPEP